MVTVGNGKSREDVSWVGNGKGTEAVTVVGVRNGRKEHGVGVGKW